LNKLEKYCYKWQLTVNTNKTKIKIFQGSNHSYSNLFYKNLSLAEAKEYNFLGNINIVIVFHIPNFTIIKYYRSN
jgi:hypothetical protein